MVRLLPLSVSIVALCLSSSVTRAQAPAAPAAGGPPATVPMMSPPMYLVIYKTGPAWKADVPDSEQLRDHGRHMFGLHVKKALMMGGPFTNGTGGAAVIHAESLAAAQALVDADPVVARKVFVAEVHAWSHVNWDELAKRLQPKPAPQP